MGRQTQPSGREDPLDVHDCSGAHQTQKALSGLEGCARNQRITRGIGKFHVSIKVWKTTSALSQLNCRVNRFEFRSGIVDPHLPVNTTLRGVDIVRPGFCFLTQTGDISEAAVCDALVRERTQCILSDVQPTAMLRRVAELEAS